MARGVASARIFVFGVGYDVNTRLLDTIAEDNRGASDYVLPAEDIEQKVGSLYSKIAYPVLSNPRLDWSDMKVYDVYPKRLPDLFRGTQTVVFGRYEGRRAARVQLIGTARGREERIAGQGDFSDEGRFNDMLPRLWAMRKVGYLLDDARRSERPVDNEVKDEIIRLSKRYGIVTPYTAGLITEDERVPMLGNVPTTGPLFRNRGAADASAGAGDGFGGAAGPAGAREERRQSASAPMLSSSLPSSGQAAVAASKATAEMREAGKVKEDANVRYVEEKAFFLKDGVWTDGTYDAQKSPKLVTVKFASPEYFALLKNPKVAKWLSVGERVIVVLKDRTVKVEP
jgi:Ca-activated chloride channel family protein